MADNLEYVCKECGFNWITLNGEHHICPKCHSETIEYIGGSARGKGPLTCGKPHPDHHDPNTPHDPKKCCGHRVC